MVRTSLLVVFFGSLAFGQQFAGFDIGSLNRSVDPCVDFYKFSCGGWQTKNPLPAESPPLAAVKLMTPTRPIANAALTPAACESPDRYLTSPRPAVAAARL